MVFMVVRGVGADDKTIDPLQLLSERVVSRGFK